MPLTRIELVDVALRQAQLDSGFQNDGRIWLNLIIEEQARNFKWPFYNKLAPQVDWTPGQNSYDLPSDFLRSDFAYGSDTDGNRLQPIPIVEAYEFDYGLWGATSGIPQNAYVDRALGKIIFDATPSSSEGGYRLRYFKKFTDLSTNSTDDNVIPDFEDQAFLIQELIKWCHKFTDDERYQEQKQEAAEKLIESKRNVYENDATSKIQLNGDIFRGRYWTR